jgi:DNA mismatch repair protein MutL
VLQRKAVGAPIGTVITVEHLFFNTPARLKFLKSEATEKRLISQVVQRYAMAYPNVRFVLEQDGREIFRSSGAGELADVLVNVVGLEDFRNMLAVDGETYPENSEQPIRVVGYTSSPSFNRADRGHITLFVNGRYIQDTRLSYAVIQAYHTLLMTGRFPVAVLMIDLPPESVDVNVHPTKAEVRFQNTDAVFGAIQRAVRRAVIDQAQTPLLRGGRYQMPDDEPSPEWNRGVHRQLDMSLALDGPGGYARQGGAVTLQPQQTGAAGAENEATDFEDDGDVTAIPQQRPRTLPMLRVVGQVGASYIVAEGPVGLYLIDQHAAHERILYEQFMADFARQQPMTQHTLAAQTIQVSPPDANLLEDNLETLRQVGFALEPFGPNTYVIRSIPAILADNDPVEVVAGILEDLSAGNVPGQSTIEGKIVLRVCKQAAVKAGQILSHDEMQALVRQLERTQNPLTCPHGRPTMIHMSSDQLAREFGRLGAG